MSDQDQQRAEQIVREWADLLSGVEVSHASGLLLARWIREALTDARSDALTEAQGEIARLREALTMLLADIEEYQRINHLGGENNHSQVMARAALSAARGQEEK